MQNINSSFPVPLDNMAIVLVINALQAAIFNVAMR